jgi:hypothetical protein
MSDAAWSRNIHLSRALRLEFITEHAANKATAKMAAMQRLFELYDAWDWHTAEECARQMLNHAKPYTKEKDSDYRSFTTVDGLSKTQFEPALLEIVTRCEAREGRSSEALKDALYLRNRYPFWASENHLDILINILERQSSQSENAHK